MADVVATTAYGRVAGTAEDGLSVFRGIAYGAPPVGERRFMPPAPPEPWPEVRPAVAFGPLCPQPVSLGLDSIPGDPTAQSEDCLTLNVWTPAVDSGRRPVMVFFHGGGFVTGSASVSAYHGASLCREDVVVVTANYRLGVLGWLAHPSLSVGDGAGVGFGNWGLHDQIAVLRFVEENISSFGGDPANVTVFGESAGAMSVAGLLATRAARGLFRRAVMESGAAVALGARAAAAISEEVFAELGIAVGLSDDGGAGSALRRALAVVPSHDLLAAQQAVAAKHEVTGLAFQPVVDNGLFSEHPAVSIARGSAAGVDLLVGSNQDEWTFFTLGASAGGALGEERLSRIVSRQIAAAGLSDRVPGDEMIATYRSAATDRGAAADPASLYTAMGTDWVFRVPSTRLLEAHGRHHPAVFAYLFDWESPFGDGNLGSCHALELPFVFGTYDNPFIALFTGAGPEVSLLSSAMLSAWTSFARSGDPSCEAVGEWPRYSAEPDGLSGGRSARLTMRLGATSGVVSAPFERERAWLDERLGPFGEAESKGLELDVAARRGT